MPKNTVVNDLISLVQLDIDAIHAYEQAIERVTVDSVRTQLNVFKADHHRHVTDLSTEIRKLGGTPPTFSKDFKGYLIQGFTALRSVTGTEGALKAMETNEKLTNSTYEKAVTWNIPVEVRQIVQRNLEDERRHLSYIRQAIEKKVWATKEAA